MGSISRPVLIWLAARRPALCGLVFARLGPRVSLRLYEALRGAIKTLNKLAARSSFWERSRARGRPWSLQLGLQLVPRGCVSLWDTSGQSGRHRDQGGGASLPKRAFAKSLRRAQVSTGLACFRRVADEHGGIRCSRRHSQEVLFL